MMSISHPENSDLLKFSMTKKVHILPLKITNCLTYIYKRGFWVPNGAIKKYMALTVISKKVS